MYVPALVEVVANALRRRGFSVTTVSRMPGFGVLLVEHRGRRALVWLRSSPPTRRSIERFSRVARGHSCEAVVITKKTVHSTLTPPPPPRWVVVDISGARTEAEAVSAIVKTVESTLSGGA